MNIMACINYKRRGIPTYILYFSLIIFLISATSAARDLVSEGGNEVASSIIRLPNVNSLVSSSDETCEHTYGFLPCPSKTAVGNFFLILVYGYLLFSGAVHLSNGAELLLEIVGPGLVTGLVLPLLGAFPDAMLILVSGLSGSKETAQEHVSVGMGVLAGSTIMQLTLIWGACVLVGKYDLVKTRDITVTETKGCHLRDSGVFADVSTSHAAKIMTISVLPFLVVQLAQALNSSSGRHFSILAGFVISVVLVIGYCIFQVSQPWIQERRLDYVKHKRVMTGFLKHLKKHASGKFFHQDGSVNRHVIDGLFDDIDQNKDATLSLDELRAFIVGLRFEEGIREENFVERVMKEFDSDRPDGRIDKEEFAEGILKLFANMRRHQRVNDDVESLEYLNKREEQAEKEHFKLGDFYGEEEGEQIKNPTTTFIKAILYILLGSVLTVTFADPLVDSVDSFSESTNIPNFFVSFIFLPLITNSKGAVSVISFVSKKNKKSASLAFGELYGEVTMGNVLGLSVLLALVYTRGLTWDFSSEVFIVFLVCVIMGALTCFRTNFPLWTSIVAFLLFPSSLVLVYVLDTYFGWT